MGVSSTGRGRGSGGGDAARDWRRCELAESAEKTLRNSRSRRFAHCRWLRLWRLRLECRGYQEQQEQRQSNDLQLARFGKNHAMTPKCSGWVRDAATLGFIRSLLCLTQKPRSADDTPRGLSACPMLGPRHLPPLASPCRFRLYALADRGLFSDARSSLPLAFTKKLP